MAGEKSQPPTYPGKTAKYTQRPSATTVNLIEAIQIIKTFVKSAN